MNYVIIVILVLAAIALSFIADTLRQAHPYVGAAILCLSVLTGGVAGYLFASSL